MSDLQLFDALPPHIEDALRASVARFGVIVPVVRDQDGRIIDGHHRVRIATELGVAYPERHVTVTDDDEAREIARTLNADRRQLTEEQRREVAVSLRQEGHSYRAIGRVTGVSHEQARKDVRAAGVNQLTPEQPAAVRGVDGKTYAARRPATEPPEAPAAQDEPLVNVPPTPEPNTWYAGPPQPEPEPWTAEEEDLRQRLADGETIVVTMRDRRHARLIAWAEERGLYVRIDRRSPWGNPFEMGPDGDRDTVIRNYADHYLPHKPSLLAKLPELRGKALGCWCAPEPCHGDVLKARAE